MITHRLCQALRLAFVAASSFAALAHAADPSTVAWIQEDPDASELVATKEGWSKCLSGCVLIPAKGDIENEVKLEELRAIAARDGIPLADSWWSTIHLGAWSPLPAAHAADAPPLVLSAAELAGKLQKRNAYPYLGFTPVPHWYAGSTTPDRLWQLRRSVHRESFFRLGNRLPAIEYYPIEGNDLGAKNVFAAPTWFPAPRLPTASDPAGGIFSSSREDLGKSEEAKRALEKFGENARRLHAATDFLMQVDDDVYAPLTGVATVKVFKKVEKGKGETVTYFNWIEIAGRDGVKCRVLYVVPGSLLSNASTMPVQAGVTVIGRADNLWRSRGYERERVPNHVHVDFIDKLGRRFDPYSNEVVERLVLDPVVRPNPPINVSAE
jgi:hypothetical protein